MALKSEAKRNEMKRVHQQTNNRTKELKEKKHKENKELAEDKFLFDH